MIRMHEVQCKSKQSPVTHNEWVTQQVLTMTS